MKYLLQETAAQNCIMQLLLLNANQCSLFVWFVNLFVVGTSLTRQRFIYFRNLPELKLVSQMGKLPSDVTADSLI